MKLKLILIALFSLVLMACGKPEVPEPNVEGYGQTIQPDHNVPAEHQ